jgi:hypothetical protein
MQVGLKLPHTSRKGHGTGTMAAVPEVQQRVRAAVAHWRLTVLAELAAALGPRSTPFRMMLARARPGSMLPWRPQEPLDDLVGIAAELLLRLWAAPSGSRWRLPRVPAAKFPTNAAFLGLVRLERVDFSAVVGKFTLRGVEEFRPPDT